MVKQLFPHLCIKYHPLRLISISLLLFLFPLVDAGEFSARADLLYLAPSYDETYFVINGSGLNGAEEEVPNGKRINNPIGYNLGFRLEGTYLFTEPCFDVRLRWTHLYATSREQVSNHDFPEQLWPTESIPSQVNISEPFAGSATSRIGLMYQKGEFLVNERVFAPICWNVTLRQGIEWSYIRYHERVQYTDLAGAQEEVQFHGHTKGLGPQIGVLVFCLPGNRFAWYPKNLAFKWMSTATLIAANSKAKLTTEDVPGVRNKVTQTSFWRFVPEWHLSFGFNYLSCFSCCTWAFEFGYEITTYIRGTSKLIFDEAANPGHSFNRYSDFYVHGLFFGTTLTF